VIRDFTTGTEEEAGGAADAAQAPSAPTDPPSDAIQLQALWALVERQHFLLMSQQRQIDQLRVAYSELRARSAPPEASPSGERDLHRTQQMPREDLGRTRTFDRTQLIRGKDSVQRAPEDASPAEDDSESVSKPCAPRREARPKPNRRRHWAFWRRS